MQEIKYFRGRCGVVYCSIKITKKDTLGLHGKEKPANSHKNYDSVLRPFRPTERSRPINRLKCTQRSQKCKLNRRPISRNTKSASGWRISVFISQIFLERLEAKPWLYGTGKRIPQTDNIQAQIHSKEKVCVMLRPSKCVDKQLTFAQERRNMNACKLSTAVQQSKRHSPAKVIKIVHARINVNTASNSVGI